MFQAMIDETLQTDDEDPTRDHEERRWSQRDPEWYKKPPTFDGQPARVRELADAIIANAADFHARCIDAWLETYKAGSSATAAIMAERTQNLEYAELRVFESLLREVIIWAHRDYPAFFTRANVMRLTAQGYEQARTTARADIEATCAELPFGTAGFESKYFRRAYYRPGFLQEAQEGSVGV